jgi:hypothetical protein
VTKVRPVGVEGASASASMRKTWMRWFLLSAT